MSEFLPGTGLAHTHDDDTAADDDDSDGEGPADCEGCSSSAGTPSGPLGLLVLFLGLASLRRRPSSAE